MKAPRGRQTHPPLLMRHALGDWLEDRRELLTEIVAPRRTIFDCIDKNGQITDEGWSLLGLKNPHKENSDANG